jgi:GntR family transcriptional regulator
VVLDRIYLLADLFAGLTPERLNNGERSLYSLFENEFGVRMIRAEERLRAVAADEYSGGLLGVPAGAPLLLVERIAHTYGDKPVEWRRGLYCTTRHHYRNDLG